MPGRHSVLFIAIVALLTAPPVGAERIEPIADGPLHEQPVAAGGAQAAQLLRRLARTSRLAGNVGDIYDNRDRGHANIRLNWFPQLRRVVYDEPDRKADRDWALTTAVREGVVVGNSSTAGNVTRRGSNARAMYAHDRGLALGWAQYTHNNLYVYPSHHDYTPGPFGIDQAGDWFHANTPYVIVSQGSSGSDRPLVHAVLWALAAMKPDVKDKLRERRLLMPAIQMLLRRSQKRVADAQAYLSGAAHPPVFDADRLDVRRMIRLAHRLSPDRLPPLAVVRIVSESPSQRGRDYWLASQPEHWAQTPAAISRVYRGPRPYYQMILDASGSVELNDQPMTCHWELLRGHRSLVSMTPLNSAATRVRVRVRFHNDPFDAPDRPAVQSRRVDIGCFVQNSDHYSPPALVSIYMPPQLRHTVDPQDRVVEIGSGAYASALAPPGELADVVEGRGGVTDWPGLARALVEDSRIGRMLNATLSAEHRRQLSDVRQALSQTLGDLQRKRQALGDAEAAVEAATDPARRTRLEIRRDTARRVVKMVRMRLCRQMFGQKVTDGRTPCDVLIAVLKDAGRDPTFYTQHQQTLGELSDRARATRKQLAELRIIESVEGRWRIRPVRTSPAPLAERLTVFERNQLRALHEQILSDLCGGRLVRPERLRGDASVVTPHVWRDVYAYDPRGRMTGWRRYADGEVRRFNRHGQVIEPGGDAGSTPRDVRYEVEGAQPASRRLRMVVPAPAATAEDNN